MSKLDFDFLEEIDALWPTGTALPEISPLAESTPDPVTITQVFDDMDTTPELLTSKEQPQTLGTPWSVPPDVKPFQQPPPPLPNLWTPPQAQNPFKEFLAESPAPIWKPADVLDTPGEMPLFFSEGSGTPGDPLLSPPYSPIRKRKNSRLNKRITIPRRPQEDPYTYHTVSKTLATPEFAEDNAGAGTFLLLNMRKRAAWRRRV